VSYSAGDRDALAAWLRLTLLPGVGTAGQRSLLKAFGAPEAIFEASAAALASVVGAELARVVCDHPTAQAVETSLTWAQEPQHHLLPLDHPRYPPALLDIPDPPNLLYGKGDLGALDKPGLAVVGSRNATAGGLQTAERFARALADCGFTVVSGLALGIDAAAHLGALASGRPNATIAVIGTGIDRVYPARNQALARRIVDEGGLILSEFALGVGVQAHHFPRRNRLIAGLAKGVLVVEAAIQSGSLITARLAGEQGREVFAIPGSIHSAQSKGCHRLIREGAKLVESAADILDEIGRPGPAATGVEIGACNFSPTTPLFGDSLLCALGGDPLTIDELAKRCDLTADSLLAMLFELEMAGRVAALPGGRYQRLG
jgi:DNA processing protein